MKPISPHDKQQLITLLSAITEWITSDLPTATPCNLCENFEAGYCNKFDMSIPAEHLEAGCEDWLFNHNLPPF